MASTNRFHVIDPSRSLSQTCSMEEAETVQSENPNSIIAEFVSPADRRRVKIASDLPVPRLRVFQPEE